MKSPQTPSRGKSLGLAAALLAVAPAASGVEVWQLDNLQKIGGHVVEVVGAPRVIEEKEAKMVIFDGASDGLFVPAVPIVGAKQFTIEVLFRPAESGGTAQRFVHLQDTAGRRALIETRLNGKGGWWLDTYLWADGEGLALVDAKRVHPTDRWYWAALRYDGKRMTHFVNGVKELEGEIEFSPMGPGQVSLGVRQNKVYWFKGAIREVRFHTEALPDEKLARAAGE